MKKLGVLLVALFVGVFAAKPLSPATSSPTAHDRPSDLQSAPRPSWPRTRGVKISVSGGGSGNGIKALIDGTADVANYLAVHEGFPRFKLAVEKGFTLCLSRWPSTAIVPIVNPANKVANLTTSQLQDIYTGKVTNWKQVGGEDKPIVAVGRDTSSALRSLGKRRS